MACLEVRTTTNNNPTNTICDLLKKIDQLQKEAILNNAAGACNTCLLTSMFNTKPVALYTCNGPLELPLTIPGTDTQTTRLFRIEDVRNCETLTLRLLVNDGTTVECTGQTAVVSLSCICGLQCFDPINCDLTCNAGI